MRKAIGSTVLVSFVIYLFAKGALVMRPRETVVALSALIAALAQACSGQASDDRHEQLASKSNLSVSTSRSPQDRASFEERGQRDPVGHGQGHERREGHVDPTVLDHAQVLGVKPGQLGGLFLGQLALFTELPKPKAETALGSLDWLPQSGTRPHL
jgi:hypothetical protein